MSHGLRQTALCRSLRGVGRAEIEKEGARGGTMGSPTLEWDEYRVQLTEWEMKKYLAVL